MPPSRSPEFAEKLRERREQLGLSLRELSKMSGISFSLLSYVESGARSAPHPDRLRGLAEALELPISELYSWAGIGSKADLPTIVPYLRTKYSFTKRDAEDIARFIEERAEVRRKRGGKNAKPSR